MNYQHKELANGQWEKLSFCEQMANIGSEVERTIKWKSKNKPELSQRAFIRALELLDLSLSVQKTSPRLKELSRLREILADYFTFDNIYKSDNKSLQKYFMAFNFAARN